MYQVTKRDGSVANFEIGKISAAITSSRRVRFSNWSVKVVAKARS